MKRGKEVTLDYVDLVLSDGTIWRVSVGRRLVYEIQQLPGDVIPTVRGPVSLGTFIRMVEDEQRSRER